MWHNILITAETLFFIYAAYLAGDLVFRLGRIEPAGALRRAVYAVTVGYGAIGVAGVLLGLLGALTFFYLNLLFGGILIVSGRTIAAQARYLAALDWSFSGGARLLAGLFREHAFLKIILVLWLAINFVFVFVPITGHDVKMYRMPLMLEMVREGGLTFTSPVTEYLWMPLLAETIYVIPMIAFGNTAAPFVFQLLQYSTLVLLLGLVYAFLRERLGHSFLAFLGLFFVLALFDLEREVLHGGYTDVFVYLFGLGSLLLVVEYCATPAARVRRGLILSAILLGFALSVKQTALFIAPANALILFTAFVRRRMTFSQQLARLGAYGLIVVLIAGFWYAKNSYLFDSPLYAGGLTLSETIIVERTVPNMFLFPFYRFAIIGNKDSASRLIVLGYFVFIYAALAFFALFDRTKIKPEHLLLFAFSHLYLYLIFFISHHTRYFVPALVALPVLAALLIDRMYQYGAEVLGTRMHQKLLRVSLVCFQVLLVLLFIGNIRYFYVKFLYKTGVLTEQEYITEIGGL